MLPKNPAAVALGRKGGEARAKKLSPHERSEAARKAVTARWQKKLTALEAKIEKRSKQKKAPRA